MFTKAWGRKVNAPAGLRSMEGVLVYSGLGGWSGLRVSPGPFSTFMLIPNAPIHGCCATLWRHAGSSAGAQQTSSLPSRHPPTHRTPTVSLATPAIGAFGLIPNAPTTSQWQCVNAPVTSDKLTV